MTEKDNYQAEIYQNRISKKYRQLRKWSRKNRISCFRIYDRDIPEVPLCVDVYEFLPEYVTTPLEAAKFIANQNQRYSNNDPLVENETALRRYAVIYLYERPYEKPEEEEIEWLSLIAQKTAETLNIEVERVITKMRKHQKGSSQYEKTENELSIKGITQEQGELFRIDLKTYLDTGLFFDHRPLRKTVGDTSSNKSVLNLFCYTGSFSVYAASGNAKKVTSVDLSNTYLAWAKENMELNGFTDKSKYQFVKSDVLKFLDEKIALAEKKLEKAEKFDIIVLDPPTFSNSKMSENTLDINRQWPILVEKCIRLLNKKGVLYFSTNSRHLSFDEKLLPAKTDDGIAVKAVDITAQTIPMDFSDSRPHKCWKIEI